jgi:hypothetical protein
MSDLRKLTIRLASTLSEGSEERKQVLALLDTRTAATLPRPRRNMNVGQKFRQVARKYVSDKAREEMQGYVPENKIREFISNRDYDVTQFAKQTGLVDWLTGKDKGSRSVTFPESIARWMDAHGEAAAFLGQEALALLRDMNRVQVAIAMTAATGSGDHWPQKIIKEIGEGRWSKADLEKMVPAFKWAKALTIPTF